jgi:chromosome segregation ATPase
MAADQPNDKDIKKATQQLKEIRAFLKELEDAGIEVPPALKKSLNRLQVALDTAEDLGAAFTEASQALASLERDLMSACSKVDAEMQGVCEAKVARQWQARPVKFTLDYKNPDSVSAGFIKKTVQRYTPSAVCKHWDYCRKQVAK